MEVILLKDVEKLGKQGQVVQVRDGFGRNYLVPRSLAAVATRENRAFAEAQKAQAAKRQTYKKEEAEGLAQALQAKPVQIEVKVGENEKLFGSVTPQDLADALKRSGFSLNKKQIHLTEPIRSLGRHSVTVELGPGVKTALQVEVVKK